MTTFEFIEGALLPSRPRFSLGGRSLLLGPYDSPASHDAHFAETFGSGDPILDSTDELRFSSTDGRLVSYRLRVPENPMQGGFISATSRLPVQIAIPRLPLGTHVQLPPATHTEVDDEGEAIAMFWGAADDVIRRVQIAFNFEMLLGADQIRGFMLHNPSDCLASGWRLVPPPVGDRALSRLLARYLNTLNPHFVERLDDGDSSACECLEGLRLEAMQLRDSQQRDVLRDSITSVQEIFCAPSPRDS